MIHHGSDSMSGFPPSLISLPFRARITPLISEKECMFHIAKQYIDLGYSVFGLCEGSKIPPKGFSWKPFQRRMATDGELVWMFGALGGTPNIAVVCGDVSRGLYVVDIDTHDAAGRFYEAHKSILRTVV